MFCNNINKWGFKVDFECLVGAIMSLIQALELELSSLTGGGQLLTLQV